MFFRNVAFRSAIISFRNKIFSHFSFPPYNSQIYSLKPLNSLFFSKPFLLLSATHCLLPTALCLLSSLCLLSCLYHIHHLLSAVHHILSTTHHFSLPHPPSTSFEVEFFETNPFSRSCFTLHSPSSLQVTRSLSTFPTLSQIFDFPKPYSHLHPLILPNSKIL